MSEPTAAPAPAGTAKLPDTWNPDQYHKFQRERSQPFYDLLGLVKPTPGGRAVDLGCGSGELTKALHERLSAVETLGLDNSEAMLAKAAAHAGAGLRFETGDISQFAPVNTFDVIFTNAALQWVPDHPRLLANLARALKPGGQLAVQVPANGDHPSHATSREIAAEEPFRTYLADYIRVHFILTPEEYASQLYDLGFVEQHVRLQVFPHELESRDAVVEWVKGTLLTDYQRRLPAELYPEFLARYRKRLMPRLRDTQPFFYGFKRILLWARRPGA